MKCTYCGSENMEDARFCSFCGMETVPMAQKAAPGPGWVRWLLAWLWLAAALAGWACALVLLPMGPESAAPESPPAAQPYRMEPPAALADADWYRWDPETGVLQRWRFIDGILAQVTPAGEESWQKVDYTRSPETGNVTIGYVADPTLWEYDALEGCFWERLTLEGQEYRLRIFAAQGTPGGTAQAYLYRVDG